MNTPSILTNINTHNSTKPITRCFKKRHCNRPTCHMCIARRRDYIVNQMFPKLDELRLEQHLTITILGFHGSFEEAFDLLFLLRPKFLRILNKTAPIFCCLSVVENSENSERIVPHFHIICSNDIDRRELIEMFIALFGIEVKAHSRALGKTREDLKRLIGYWLDQNVRPTSINKPKWKRLLTGPRGILLGRPKYHFAPEEFRLLEEMNNATF